MFGIELELPHLFGGDVPRRLFFWVSEDTAANDPFEAPALQALQCLQNIYHFSVKDYSSEHLAVCMRLARHLFSVANSGARLARLVLAEAETRVPSSSLTISAAEELLQDAHSIANSF